MIFSGRHLARAWLTVALAASDDPARPVVYRTVFVDQYDDAGVLLTATDSYWLASVWVPDIDHDGSDGEDPAPSPGLDYLGDRRAVVSDGDGLVRALFKHVQRLTRKEDWDDVPVSLSLDEKAPDDQEAQQRLTSELRPLVAIVEVPGDLRVLATQVEMDPPNWRKLAVDFMAMSADGAVSTAMSGWMLDKLSKAAKAAGGLGVIEMEWLDDQRANWAVRDAALTPPAWGLFMAVGGPKKDQPASDEPEIEQPPDEPDGGDG